MTLSSLKVFVATKLLILSIHILRGHWQTYIYTKNKYFQVQFLTHSHSGKGEYSQKTALRNCPERNNPERNNPKSRKNPKH